MTGLKYKEIVEETMRREFVEIPDPEELEYEYRFSSFFEQKMNELIKQSRSYEDAEYERRYIRVGNHRLKKTVVLVAVFVIIMAITACAAHLIVIWNETDNKEQGTLDVTFEVRGDADTENVGFIYPEVPEGFEIVKEHKYERLLALEYRNSKGEGIIYCHSIGIENASMSIDNDDEGFSEIEINGYKGYATVQGNDCFLMWTDGVSMFEFSANIPLETVTEMAEKMYE